ncbi:hypothetical protein ACEZDB_35595 [Streptacidiphilus sp. N1-3]|uniref:Uncharacterized protein n=1 Tax=Streptacidiphilus alkalitolerans TaxID=3342712 RepID=A0ABV6XCH9_9ACTN
MTPDVGALERSEDEVHRIGQYQHHQSSAELRIVEVLAWAGLGAAEIDELMCSVEAGVIAGMQCIAVEMAYGPRDRGEEYEQGYTAGARRITDYLVESADRAYEQRGQAASALQLIAHLRQRERDQAAGGGYPGRSAGSGESPAGPHGPLGA